MQTKLFRTSLAAMLSVVIFSTVALAEAPAPVRENAAEIDAARWVDIGQTSYEMRAAFFAGFETLEAKASAQSRALIAQRAAMKGTTDTREWDFAMKEMESARSYLHSVGTEMRSATADNWDQQKDKVGRAWVSTQDAYKKVKSSTTT